MYVGAAIVALWFLYVWFFSVPVLKLKERLFIADVMFVPIFVVGNFWTYDATVNAGNAWWLAAIFVTFEWIGYVLFVKRILPEFMSLSEKIIHKIQD